MLNSGLWAFPCLDLILSEGTRFSDVNLSNIESVVETFSYRLLKILYAEYFLMQLKMVKNNVTEINRADIKKDIDQGFYVRED